MLDEGKNKIRYCGKRDTSVQWLMKWTIQIRTPKNFLVETVTKLPLYLRMDVLVSIASSISGERCSKNWLKRFENLED